MGRFIDITGAPIVSDFQEMPLDFINKELQLYQDSFDKSKDLEGKFITESGIRSKKFNDYVSKKYEPEIQKISQTTITNPIEGYKQMEKLYKKFSQDPVVAFAKEDAKNVAEVQKLERERSEKGKPFYGYRDKFGNVEQINPEDVEQGKIGYDFNKLYAGIGYADYTKPIRDIYEKSPTIKKIVEQNLDPSVFDAGDLGYLMKTGKISEHIDEQTLENLQSEINNVAYKLLNEGSPEDRYFRVQAGLQDVYGNWLVDNKTAIEKGYKYATQIAQDYLYSNRYTVNDVDYKNPATGSKADRKNQQPELEGIGTVDEQGIDRLYKELEGKTSQDILNNISNRFGRFLTEVQKGSISKDSPLYKAYLNVKNPDGSVNYEKLANLDTSTLKVAAQGNQVLKDAIADLEAEQFNHDIIKKAETEATEEAIKLTGYNDKYSDLQEYKKLLDTHITTPSLRIKVLKDGTIQQYQENQKTGNEFNVKTIGKVPQDKVQKAINYINERGNIKSSTSILENKKKELIDTKLKSNLQQQQEAERINFTSEKQQKEFNDKLASGLLLAASRGSKTDESIFVDAEGNPVDVSNLDLSNPVFQYSIKNSITGKTSATFTVKDEDGNVRKLTIKEAPKNIVNEIESLRSEPTILMKDINQSIAKSKIRQSGTVDFRGKTVAKKVGTSNGEPIYSITNKEDLNKLNKILPEVKKMLQAKGEDVKGLDKITESYTFGENDLSALLILLSQ